MRKQTVEYTSPLDALIAVTRRLVRCELQHGMSSEDFYAEYSRGELADDAIFVEWANDYRHYMELRRIVEDRLKDVA